MEVLKPSSLERAYKGVLSPIFAAAAERRCISTSPCCATISLPFIDDEEQYHCTEDEIHLLADALEAERYSALHVIFLAYTGLRFAEFAGLKVKYLDLEARTIRIEGQVAEGKGGKWAYTRKLKTRKARRTVGIPRWLAEALRDHLEGHTSEYLFCEADGGFVRYAAFKRAFIRTRRRVGLDDVHIHSLRHTYAAMAIARGVDLFHISRLLGHSSITVTVDTYGHLCPENVHRVADVMEQAPDRTPRLVSVI